MNSAEKKITKAEKRPVQDIYSEEAVWLCENRQTGFKTRVNGVLAQILKKYPADYRLKLLKHTSIKEETADV